MSTYLCVSQTGIRVLTDELSHVDGVDIYDAAGRLLFSMGEQETNAFIPVHLETQTVYLIKVKTNNSAAVFKYFIK